MRNALGIAVALLVAGCSSQAPAATDSTGPHTGGGSAAGDAPPGWQKDPCDTREGRFSAVVQPRDRFLRAGDASAAAFAAHVVEAAGDRIVSTTTPEGAAGRNEAKAWQTESGVVEVFWETDPAAWSAVYKSSRANASPDAADANQTAHAILGSLGVPLDGVEWTSGPASVTARRVAGGGSLPLVQVDDQEVAAEQARILRRDVRVAPDYQIPSEGLLGQEAARAAAEGFLDCKAADLQATGELALLRVVKGHLAYQFNVEPEAGWGEGCPWEAAGRLRVALDAVTGTVLESDLQC